ncbi:MAG: DUF262 domain-containing protein [Candidatus Paceibacterota bacterium]|jgi:hypothetical protein
MDIQSKKRSLDKIYKRRDRYDIPDWQREEVWDNTKKQLLIDSILHGWKLPKFYFQKTADEPETFEVVDGQQRLTAILEFLGNELPLSDKSAKDFRVKYYKDLPQKLSDDFDDFEIEYDEITNADETEVKEFFQRLQNGLRLTSSENLNSIHSNLRDYCRKLSTHSFFKNKVSFPDKRYAFFDATSKIASIEIDGIEIGLRHDDIKEVFESQKSFSAKSAVAKRLEATLDYLDHAFPKKNPVLRNRTIVQSVATLAGKIVVSGKSAGSEASFREFVENFMEELSRQVELGNNATDQDYLLFQRSVSANVRGTAKKRQEILLRKLLGADASFASLLDPAAIAESGITADITRLSDSIANLVSKANDAYSAEHGENLFKTTNKTAPALKKIGIPITDYSSYKTLVEELYFVFWEGPGQRLSTKPNVFVDINMLRTGLLHDTEHGKTKDVKKKKTTIGATFSKYASTATPSTLAPEQFTAVQSKLLSEVERAISKIIAAGFKKITKTARKK